MNVKDSFTIAHKRELIEILESKISLNSKWIRLNDAIEDLIDSYIGFLNEKTVDILTVDLSRGIQLNGD